MKQLWVIGDIHGFSLALDRLLERIAPDSDDTIVTLGDYIDRGPDSRGVINRLLTLQKECNLVPIRGNHEEMLLTLLARERNGTLHPSVWQKIAALSRKKPQLEMTDWLDLGGRQTLASYGRFTTQISQIDAAHLDFIGKTLLYYETEHFIFTHAAYIPELKMEDQPQEVLLNHRLRISVPDPHISGKTVYVGHSAQRNGEIFSREHLICIDTYLYGGGWLTAVEPSSGKTLQIDAGGRFR